MCVYVCGGGGCSVVGIATEYTGWTVRGSNPSGGEIIRTSPDRPWGPPASCTIGTGSFPGVKSDWGVTLTRHPLLMPWSRKSRAIPLLPLWVVRPVQSLSPGTRVHLTFYVCVYIYIYIYVCVCVCVCVCKGEVRPTRGHEGS